MRFATAVLLACIATPVSASDYYKVQVTRKAQDLYQVDFQSIYVKTRFCHEYVHSSEAILKIDSQYGYNIGEIIFVGNGGGKCDVEKLL
jgi:hypothetical protein